ncbi:hypothetical protein GpartN1_g778.t1 [Galdieria partita]|uniref:Anaphase-promoting complex subunit 5 n=1 Tax=Galdieria partita TaxID=83374 RepID=A0A9C7PS49_9RHOD|nr:hypothetical protein GpartN1_g778.t1 [Galdieria partita]
MERQIAIAYLSKRRIFNALRILSLCAEDLQTLNLEVWKRAAHCDRFPEGFDAYLDPSFLISDCLENVLHSSQESFVQPMLGEMQHIETVEELLNVVEQLKVLTFSEETTEHNDDHFVHLEGPIGQFLRRIIIAVDSLSFEDICLLLDSWNSADVSEEEFRNPITYAWDFQVPCSLLPQNDHEAHRLLEGFNYGFIPSDEFLNISLNDSSTTKAELVRFLQSIESADLLSSISSLHRYFDMELCSLDCGPQQASLLLAAAYFTLGIQPLSIVNLHETIKVSQQTGDKYCQLHALLWLCLADMNKKHLLMERVKQLAKEPSYNLLASVKLEEWRICGKGMFSSFEWNTSQDAEQISMFIKDYVESFHSSSGSSSLSRIALCILEAEMWRLKGFLDISYNILEECCSREATGLFSYPFLQCVCVLSLFDLERGNFELALERFEPAIQYLSSIESDRVHRTLDKDLIRIHVLYVIFWRSFYRQERHMARLALEKIESIVSSVEYSSSIDHALMVLKAKCALAQLEGDYQSALRICSEWERFSILKEKPLGYLEAKIYEADIFLHVNTPVKALLPALQVVKISEMNNIEYYRLVASLIVTEVQCQMHQFEAAQNSLRKIEPLLANSVPPLYQGKAYLFRAHIQSACYLQNMSFAANVAGTNETLSATLKDIQSARDCFQKMQACCYIRECQFLHAMIQQIIQLKDKDLGTGVSSSNQGNWLQTDGKCDEQFAYYQVLEKLNKL